jgi:hypothetical protein
MSVILTLICHASTDAVREAAFPPMNQLTRKARRRRRHLPENYAGSMPRGLARRCVPRKPPGRCNLTRRSIPRSGILISVVGQAGHSVMCRNLTPMGSRHGSVRAMQRHTGANPLLRSLSASPVGSMRSSGKMDGSRLLPIPPSFAPPSCLQLMPNRCRSGASTSPRSVASVSRATRTTGRFDQLPLSRSDCNQTFDA